MGFRYSEVAPNVDSRNWLSRTTTGLNQLGLIAAALALHFTKVNKRIRLYYRHYFTTAHCILLHCTCSFGAY